MPIATVLERSGVLYVYDEQGRQLCSLRGGSRPGDGLQGHTATTVSVRRAGVIYIYDERGTQLSSIRAG